MKISPLLLALAGLALATAGCQSTPNTNNIVQGGSVSSSTAGGLTGAQVRNNIDLSATGTKVKAAYLMDEQNQYKEANTAALNEKVILTIELDTGWVKENGKSYIGASERIVAKDGTVVLDAPDLLSDYDQTGLPADIAKLINLTAIIDKVEPGFEDFTVQFRVWDKKGTGEVKGSYVFTVKP